MRKVCLIIVLSVSAALRCAGGESAASLSAVAWPSVPLWGEVVSENLAEATADSSRIVDLDEVVVVSQPKETFRLRQQSLSASMFSAKDIGSLGVRDLRDLSSFVPSFSMPGYGSRYTSSVYVRGIGSRVNSPAIGIYVDGIPLMSKSAFNFHTYQLERIDVLRGPQGTLYGQNTEGGLIRMYSRNPMHMQGTDILLGIGTHFYRNAEVSHAFKVSPRLAFSLSGFYNGQNGFFKNQTTGERADLQNEAGGKLKWVWQPSERWDVSGTADYQYVRQNGFPYGELDLESGRAASPSANWQGNYRRNILNTGMELVFHGNYFDVSSATSYQYLKDYMLMDIDYTGADFMHMKQRQFQNAFTQELALKDNQAGWWHWTVGSFFSAQWLKTGAPVYFDEAMTAPIAKGIESAMYTAMVNSMAGRMAQQGMPMEQAVAVAERTIAAQGGVSMEAAIDIPGVFRTPVYNIGLYHESNIRLGERLTATLGLRYDYSHAGIHYETAATMTMAANVMGQQAVNRLTSFLDHSEGADYNQLLPKVGLRYDLGQTGGNLYAVWSKGYRAGGFNIQMFSDILQTELNTPENRNMANRGDYDIPHTEEAYARIRETIAYQPETSWNYEVGAHLNLFGHSAQLDLAAYYMQVKNQQLSVMAEGYGFGRMMVNAGKSYSCGVEASLKGQALDNRLTWALSYGYTHAVFKEYTDGDTSYKDCHVPFVPQHTFGWQADYRWVLGQHGLRALVLGVNGNGQGKIYWNEANTYGQNLYATLGAHVDADFGLFQLSLRGMNLTNTKYNTFAFDSSATGEHLYFAQQGNPIQMLVNLSFHF